MTPTGTAPPITGPVNVSFYSELMKNYSPELPVDATHQLEALQAGTTPWVFSVGTDNTLYAITRREGSGTGWVQHALSAGMGEVTAFGAAEAGGGVFRLAVAVQSGGSARFYLSRAADFTTLNLAAFDPATFWTEHALADPAATVNQVRVDGAGALIATTKTGSDAVYYTVDDTGVKPYALPENGSTVLALELGQVYGDRGVFLLYTVGAARTLLFQSFPDAVDHKTSKYRYAPPGAVNDFALLAGAGGTNGVVAAGDAVTLFTTPDDAPQTVAAATAGLSFTSVRAAQHDSTLSLWLLGASGGAQSLYYATNHFYQGSTGTFTRKWTAPLAIRRQVGRFDCLRGTEVSNHLFVVSQQNTLVHLWQDAATTLWQEAEVPVHDAGKARVLDTYTVHVQFSPTGPRDSLAGQTVTVSADAALYVNLNGAGYQLGPSTPGQVPLDAGGNLTVMSVTCSIAAPTLTVTAPFLDATVTVDLMHKVRERLEPVKTGADLQGATRYDPATNQQVPLTTGQDSGTLDAVAKGVGKFNDAAGAMKSASPAARAAVRAFAAASRPAAGASVSWGMSFPEEGGAVFHQGPQAALHFARRASVGGARASAALDFGARGIWDDLGHAFGDVIRQAGDAIGDVKDFFIQLGGDVVHFAIRVGTAVYTFILTTAHEVYAAAELLFKKIALYLKELIEWLGFLFAWKDILATRDAMKELFNNGLSSFSGAVQKIRSEFDGWVGGVLANDLNSPELARRLNDTTARTADQSVAEAGGRPQGSADPRVHWVATRLPHLAGAGSVSGGGTTPGGVMGDILASIESLAGDFAMEYDKVSSYGTQWANGQITTAQFAVAVLDAVGAVALDIVQRIVDGVLNAVSGMIDTLGTFLNHPIDIPFFSALYESVAGDPLSILDVAALIMAIPVTVSYKAMFKEAPFQNGVGNDLLNAPAHFFSTFSLGGAHGGVHAMGSQVLAAQASSSTRTRVAAVMIGIVRVLRTATFALVTAAALAPQPAGTTLLLVIDQFLRVYGALAGLRMGDPNALKALSLLVFVSFLCINVMLYKFQREEGTAVTWSVSTPNSLAGRLGQNFNIGGAIDTACVTSIGIWGAVLTSEGWDAKSQAARAAEVLNEIFQIPAIVGFFANTIARNSGDNPYAVAAAGIVAAIRDAGLLGSGISELVVAGQA